MDRGLGHCTGGSDKDHPQEREMQNGKMVVWRGLTNSWEKKKAKGKGEKERYTDMNAESQRRARKAKKAFLSDQCKEIEENNRMEILELSSRKLEIPRVYIMQIWAQ